jgi:hypothetical protein
MERSEILTTMGELKLYGMKAAFDEIITTAVKRQHEPQRVVGDLLTAEISEKQARSIKYQITIAKLPLAKDISDFTFGGTPINETVCRSAASPAGGSLRDGARSHRRQFPGASAQRGSGRRDRHGKESSRHCNRPCLYPQRCAGPVLQCRRSGQPT